MWIFEKMKIEKGTLKKSSREGRIEKEAEFHKKEGEGWGQKDRQELCGDIRKRKREGSRVGGRMKHLHALLPLRAKLLL